MATQHGIIGYTPTPVKNVTGWSNINTPNLGVPYTPSSSTEVVTKDLTKPEEEGAVTPAAIIPEGGGGGGFPNFEVDLAGIWEKAGQMADADLAPQLANIDMLLQQAGYTADESKRAIDEAYPIARRSIQKSVYENFVAGEGRLAGMGTGRGGGRQELLARGGEREAVGISGLEDTRTREKGAIDRALESYKGQQGNLKTSILGTRGGLQAGYSEQLRANRFNEAALTYGAATDQWNANQSFVSPSGSSVGEVTNTLLGGTPSSTTTDPYAYFYNMSAGGASPNDIQSGGEALFGSGYNPYAYVDPKTKKPTTWHSLWGK